MKAQILRVREILGEGVITQVVIEKNYAAVVVRKDSPRRHNLYVLNLQDGSKLMAYGGVDWKPTPKEVMKFKIKELEKEEDGSISVGFRIGKCYYKHYRFILNRNKMDILESREDTRWGQYKFYMRKGKVRTIQYLDYE